MLKVATKVMSETIVFIQQSGIVLLLYLILIARFYVIVAQIIAFADTQLTFASLLRRLRQN